MVLLHIFLFPSMLTVRLKGNGTVLLIWEMFARNSRGTSSENANLRTFSSWPLEGKTTFYFVKLLLPWVSGAIVEMTFKWRSELPPNSLLLYDNIVNYALHDIVSRLKPPKVLSNCTTYSAPATRQALGDTIEKKAKLVPVDDTSHERNIAKWLP